MENKVLELIDKSLHDYGKKAVIEIMDMVTADIKTNRIPFNRMTKEKDIIDLFNMNLSVYLRSC